MCSSRLYWINRWLWPSHWTNNINNNEFLSNHFYFGLKKQRKTFLYFHMDPFICAMFFILVINIGLFLSLRCLYVSAEVSLNVKLNMFPSSALRLVCSLTAFSIHISLQQDWDCEIYIFYTLQQRKTFSEKHYMLGYSQFTVRFPLFCFCLWKQPTVEFVPVLYGKGFYPLFAILFLDVNTKLHLGVYWNSCLPLETHQICFK